MIKNIDDFIASVGGTNLIALKLKIHQFTVDRWRIQGIPLKYWDRLMQMSDVTPAELFYVTKKVLSRKK